MDLLGGVLKQCGISIRQATRSRRIRVVLGLLLSIHGRAASPQKSTADEYEIRAAILYNLTKFIEWPAAKMDASHAEFTVCLLGSDPLGAYLDRTLQGKTVTGKIIHVRHLDSIGSANSCHILYIGAGERNVVARVAPELERNSVLTISERSNADNPSQLMGLPTAEDHVRIDINRGAAERSGLTISSRLLQLATLTH